MPQEELKIHEFETADREWLWFIANNRRKRLASAVNKLVEDIAAADVIIGKVANDQTNPVLAIYLNGFFGDIYSEKAVNETIRQLLPDHLVDQYCFLTEKAITCLEFQEARKYVVK